MRALEPLVLPSDVVVAALADLPPEHLAGLREGPGDHCVTRPQTRTVSIVVDADTARLLTRFRTPTTIVDAVIAYCADGGSDPDETLGLAFATLTTLVEESLLVPAESQLARPVGASLAVGARVDGLTVAEPVHVLADTEVYRARMDGDADVALKIAGVAAPQEVVAALRHEAAVLGLLDGRVNARLRRSGHHDDRPYLVIDWHLGADLYQAAADAHELPPTAARGELLGVAEGVLEAYAHLHALGVIHGDVQPRNVLVGAAGGITLLDYGLAGVPARGWLALRGGVDIFQAPEIARARLERQAAPPLSLAAEIYAIAALLHLLLTGRHTHAFSMQRDEMLRQVVDEPRLSFGDCGVDLPEVDSCLSAAFAKIPQERPASVAEMLATFRGAAARDQSRRGATPRSVGSDDLLDAVLDSVRADGELLATRLAPPTASVTYGAAGIAYALLRIARVRADDVLLAAADVWSTRAVAELASERGLWSADLAITPEGFGRASLFHHAAGVHCVDALVAQARDDDGAQVQAMSAFVAASASSERVDIAFGRSGLLLGCALLLDAVPEHLDRDPLRALGDRLLRDVWGDLDVPPENSPDLLGVAHGRAGCHFAILRWCEATETRPPAGLADRLDELAALGEPHERGRRWPRELGGAVAPSPLLASWCNGAAGHAQLWTLAHRVLGDSRWEPLADEAAWEAWAAPSDVRGDLCCGLAGRAYALLSRYRATSDARWLARAQTLARAATQHPAIDDQRRHSLYHGLVGIAVLAADVEYPEHAAMPLFEAEGSSRH